MKNAINKPPARVAWMRMMNDAFESGRDSEAVETFDAHVRRGQVPPNVAIVRAQIALRTPGQSQKALPLLKSMQAASNGSDYVWQQMLLGEAHAVSGDYVAADDRLQRAMQTATHKGDAELIAAVGSRIGGRFVLQSDPQRAREGLALAKAGRSTESKLAAQLLESRILESESRTHEQARVLIRLLASIDPRSEKHMVPRVAATYSLAVCSRESHIPDAVRSIERQLSGTPWPEDLSGRRFMAARSLAWTSALDGDYFNAFRYLRERADDAPNDAWRTVAYCDRAYLARARNELTWFAQELFEAQRIAESVDWDAFDDESTLALLLLAELTAPMDAARAAKYLNRFQRIKDDPSRVPFYHRERRFHALLDYVSGVVDLHHGERKRAASHFEGARAVYRTIAFEWRAARCDLRLFDATRKTAFLQEAHQWLGNYPKSWLAEEWRDRFTSSRRGSGLTPMRDRTFRLLCEGKSNLEIAQELDLSVATVANHAKAVLKFFGVSSRHALLAEARRRRLT
ncbi:MAG TPA: LuxR C-terminal-related transcriptional regulator [Candidatus Tumulicola sp.]|jgi:DNA-binding CsgD family transcriptional regulator/tetratricopeptide (TPR) repeat protein